MSVETPVNYHTIAAYTTYAGASYQDLPLSYRLFGQPLHTAPVILVNHALTGNSAVPNWWGQLIGDGLVLDTQRYTILAIDVFGNGSTDTWIEQYQQWVTKDIATLFLKVVSDLKIKSLYAIIGGSLGGGIAWEMAVLAPQLIQRLIPIAAHWESSDWLMGQCYVQECLLLHSNRPIADARQMAMLFYRTPASFSYKFGRAKSEDKPVYEVNDWLDYHGHQLANRFDKRAYLLLNQLLATIDSSPPQGVNAMLQTLSCEVIQVAITSDLLFDKQANKDTHRLLLQLHKKSHYLEIKSIHGHDAFLMEQTQLAQLLAPHF